MKADDRNIIIDLMKICCMAAIVMIHILGPGGVLNHSQNFENHFFWLIEIVLYPAINIYALITGYLLIDKDIKISNIFKLYIKVWFYSVVATIAGCILKQSLDIKYVAKAIFPVTTNYYWYFTAYFGMYVLLPYLNKYLNSLNKDSFKKLIISLIFLFGIFPTIRHGNVFGEMGGYGIIWLLVMYVIGAYIKKHCKIPTTHKKFIAIASLCIVANYSSHIVNISFKGINISNFLVSYNSITMIVYSIVLFCLGNSFNTSLKHTKIIASVSEATFGIYLIHSNPMLTNYFFNDIIWKYIIKDNYSILRYVLISFAIFFLSLIIELIRLVIDKKIGITAFIYKKFLTIYTYIKKKLFKICSAL